MQIVKLSLMATVTVVVLVNCAFGFRGRWANYGDVGQDRNVDRWVNDNYAIVLNKVLPGGEITPNKFPEKVKWMVTVRILPPFEEPEYRFSMQKTYEGKVEVSVMTPKGSSVRSQLRALKSKYPSASLEKICGSVSIDQRSFRESDSRRLSQLADEFETMNISPVLPDELRVDGTAYEFWSQSLWGNRMNVVLSGPGPSANRQPHPLLQWAESVRRAIEESARRAD